jgi:hypothetical protein
VDTEHPVIRLFLFLCLAMATSLPGCAARAADGVLEINQTCAVTTGCFPGDASGFPVTITQAGSYRLTGNLVVPSAAADAISLGADDVSIDLGGFSILGPAICTGAGASLACSPQGIGDGIDTSAGGNGASVIHGTIRGMGGLALSVGRDARISELRVFGNSAGGILITDGVVSHCRVTRNNGAGIEGNGVIEGNVVAQNSSDGILSSFGTLTGNQVTENAGYGASLHALFSSYSGNNFSLNASGSVTGGRATGGNLCDDGRCTRTGAKRFYLTPTTHDGATAMGRCASGFHMASVWELLDPSALQYDASLGVATADGGTPSGSVGWMRNGVQPFNTAGQPAGFANCNQWSTTSGVGSVWALDPLRIPGGVSRPAAWNPVEVPCTQLTPVWCVEN